MYMPHAAAIALILNTSPLAAAVTHPVGTYEPASHAAVSPCPIPDWNGHCAILDEEQRERIRTAVTAHARLTSPACQEVHALLREWLDRPHSQLWTYEHHQLDTRHSYVMGQAVRDLAGQPQGFGLRHEALGTMARMLARIALHEAAHLAGEAEAGARRIERQCVG
jgi:hypothetical protein